MAELENSTDFEALFEAEFANLDEETVAAAAEAADLLLQQEGVAAAEGGAAAEGLAEGVLGLTEAGAAEARPPDVYADDEEDELAQEDEAGAADAGPAAEVKPEEAEAGPGPSSLSARAELEAWRSRRIMESMTEAQQDRYEAYSRSSLPRAKMRKLLAQLVGGNVGERTVIALCGIGKMFVGELVELARHVAAGEGHTGPLLPRHMQRAYQLLDAADRVPHTPGSRRRMFR